MGKWWYFERAWLEQKTRSSQGLTAPPNIGLSEWGLCVEPTAPDGYKFQRRSDWTCRRSPEATGLLTWQVLKTKLHMGVVCYMNRRFLAKERHILEACEMDYTTAVSRENSGSWGFETWSFRICCYFWRLVSFRCCKSIFQTSSFSSRQGK